MLETYGPRHWWPAETPFEMCVGAILTQNTAWSNVEKAIDNLKSRGILDLESMHSAPRENIAEAIRPSGYFNQKARRLMMFCDHVVISHNGCLEDMLYQDIDILRRELLSLHGIGPETADSIILYGACKPVFVVDAYTIRIFTRLGLLSTRDYHEVQDYFTSNLKEDTGLFNEYHALLVEHGKERCRARPACRGCPLEEGCCRVGL